VLLRLCACDRREKLGRRPALDMPKVFPLLVCHLLQVEALLEALLRNATVLAVQRVVLVKLSLADAWVSFQDAAHQPHVLTVYLHGLPLLVVDAQTPYRREVRCHHVLVDDAPVPDVLL